jgi:hypothetical protein
MHDAPSADELLEAVGRFLQEVAAPGLSGQAAFHAKVAANAIATVRRELAARGAAEAGERARLQALLASQESDLDALNRALCARLRSGEAGLATPGLLAHLRATLIDQVSVDQPGYSGLAAARAGD